MSTIRNQISIDVYLFNAVGNAFVRKETQGIPVPFVAMTPCTPGPDGLMRAYTKITSGNPPKDYYVGQTISELNSLIVQ